MLRTMTLSGAIILVGMHPTAFGQEFTWVKQFASAETESGADLARMPNGDLILTGSIGSPSSDVWTARFNSDGDQLWHRSFGSPNSDGPSSVTHDGAGGFFLSGRTFGALAGPLAGLSDSWLGRYDQAGNELWLRQFGSSGQDEVEMAVSDSAGGVLIIGSTTGDLAAPNAGDWDAWLARFDGQGQLIWRRQFGAPGKDLGTAICSDGSGGVFAGGRTQNLVSPGNNQGDAWISRVDSNGTVLWMSKLGTSLADGVSAIAPDNAGGAFFAGYTYGNLAGTNQCCTSDFWIARYDGAGNQLWIEQFESPDNDAVRGATPDGSGGIYLTGGTQGSMFGPAPFFDTDWDLWSAQFDSSGSLKWGIQQSNGPEFGQAIVSDQAGAIHIIGHCLCTFSPWTQHLGQYDAVLLQFNPEPTAARHCYTSVPNSTGVPGRMAVSGSNAISDNQLTVKAFQLPIGSFGFFLTSRVMGNQPGFGGTSSTLCLGGSIGRFVAPNQVQAADSSGRFSIDLDLAAMPTPTGFIPVQTGESWYFQAWYRDANPNSTSNLTDAIEVGFQ
ncbi:MAG: hypothetical protein P1V35_06800 [Planctomycetota bacterium]|nr:hypothetical protein [Planctomycetota bacterium]